MSALPDEALAEARAWQVSLMVDICTITRTGEPAFDPETGQTTRPITMLYDNGPCRIGPPASSGPVVVAGELVTPTTVPVTVPWDVTVAPGDKVTVTTAAHDPALPGAMWVQSVEGQSFATARRFTCGNQQ